jgi:hypothetical protein
MPRLARAILLGAKTAKTSANGTLVSVDVTLLHNTCVLTRYPAGNAGMCLCREDGWGKKRKSTTEMVLRLVHMY